MCQAIVYLAGDGVVKEVMREVILLESEAEGIRLHTFFDDPLTLQARIERINFLKHTVTLVAEEE